MGAKAFLVGFGDVRTALRRGDEPDREAAEAVIRALRPGCAVEPAGDSTLGDELSPGDGFAYVTAFPDATIVCDRELVTVPADEVPQHLLDFAAGRPMVMFGQDSTAGALAFAEWAADGTLVRSHEAELDDYAFADSVAREMFGFAVEGRPGDVDKGEVVVHGFRVTYPDQAEREAELQAAVAEMVRRGPERMTIGPDGSLVPIPD